MDEARTGRRQKYADMIRSRLLTKIDFAAILRANSGDKDVTMQYFQDSEEY